MKDLWQVIYDAAANEGSILHDDTVSAIERAMEAKLCGESGQPWEEIAAVRMRRIFELAEKLAAISRQVEALEAEWRAEANAAETRKNECMDSNHMPGVDINRAKMLSLRACADALQTLKEQLT